MAKLSSETTTPTLVDKVDAVLVCSHQFTPRLVASTIEELCALGLVEKFTDGFGFTRYRPAGGRIA